MASQTHTAQEPSQTSGLTRWLAWPASVAWWEAAAYATLIVSGLAMRLWELGERAMHHDESLHALYSWNLFSGKGYHHNPMMHGPFQFEANAALFHLFGDSDVAARLLYAAMGTILIAMPFLLRGRLGRLGAISTSALLAISPAMLYFSRFARNDILMAVWTFGVVICMWRYFDEGRNRYLYISAALLALAFGSKESAYMVVAILGLWCLLAAAWPWATGIGSFTSVVGSSVPTAISRLASAAWSSIRDLWRSMNPQDSRGISREIAFLIFLIALTLPLWAAFSAIFQETPLLSWSHVQLVSPEGSPFIGAPQGLGNAIAIVIVGTLALLAVQIGMAWNDWLPDRSRADRPDDEDEDRPFRQRLLDAWNNAVWWKCAAVFYAIWALMYTTFLTNPAGFGSGIWRSLGYWIVQQGEARGNQPWYYYFVITSIYEFLPFLVGITAAIYFIRKRDRFGIFLAFWALTTFALYTIASEKMPWLLVNITLPFIVLSGKFLGELVGAIDWRNLKDNSGYLLIPGAALFAILLWSLALWSGESSALIPLAIAAALVGLAAAAVYIWRRMDKFNFWSLALLGIAALMAILSIRAGIMVSFQNGDTPVEMLVYTQTSPDVKRLIDEFERTGAGSQAELGIDSTSGFTWPWAWYMRESQRVQYLTYDESSFDAQTRQALVVHSSNKLSADEGLRQAYSEAERVRHRWWFPEHTYRNLTPGDLLGGVFDRSAWRAVADYWLNREGVRDMLGSEDSYVYFQADVPHQYDGAPPP